MSTTRDVCGHHAAEEGWCYRKRRLTLLAISEGDRYITISWLLISSELSSKNKSTECLFGASLDVNSM